MGHELKGDARLRFILRHGIVPWGTVAGACAGLGGAFGVRDEATSASPVSGRTMLGVAVLCFVIWCFVGGWIVGALRWELREIDDATNASLRNRRHRGGSADNER